MSDVKEVRVEMTAADLEAMSRPATRRRRRVGGAAAGAMGLDAGNTMEQVVVKADAPSAAPPIQTIPTVTPAVTPTVTPTVTKIVGGGAKHNDSPVATPISSAVVKIQTRKRISGTPNIAAKILPTKRHVMPSKGTKPKLIIRGGAMSGTPAVTTATTATSDLPKIPLELPTPAMTSTTEKMPTAPANQTLPVAEAQTTTPITTTPITTPTTKQSGGATRHRRRFTERRLSISVKQDKSTRKQRKSIKRQIAKMTSEEIRKILIEKKVIKPKANPPDDMLRSMMRDLLTV